MGTLGEGYWKHGAHGKGCFVFGVGWWDTIYNSAIVYEHTHVGFSADQLTTLLASWTTIRNSWSITNCHTKIPKYFGLTITIDQCCRQLRQKQRMNTFTLIERLWFFNNYQSTNRCDFNWTAGAEYASWMSYLPLIREKSHSM